MPTEHGLGSNSSVLRSNSNGYRGLGRDASAWPLLRFTKTVNVTLKSSHCDPSLVLGIPHLTSRLLS